MTLSQKIQWACMAIIAALFASMFGCAWLGGRNAAETERRIEDADFAADVAASGKLVSDAAAAAAADQSGLELRLRTEAADGRREIERYAAPPAEGSVGAGAVVDPGLGRAVLCRIERVRGTAAPGAGCEPAPN